MKLGDEPTYYHSSIANQPAHKIVDCNNDYSECKILEEDNEVVNDEKHEKASVLERESPEIRKDPLLIEKCDGDVLENTQRPHSYAEDDDSVGQTKNEFNDMFTSHSIPSADWELPENGTVYYTDKTVTQAELPELIVCCKDSSFNVVKDICVDGVYLWDKVLVEKCQVDHSRLIDILYSDLVGISDSANEGVASSLTCSEDGKFLDSSDKEVGKHGRPENLQEEVIGSVNATGDFVNDISVKKLVAENLRFADSTVPISNGSISFNIDKQLISEKKVTIKYNPSMSIEGGENIADGSDKTVKDTLNGHVISEKPLLLQELDLEERHYYNSEFSGIGKKQPDQGHALNMDGVNLRPLGASVGIKLASSTSASSKEISLACNNTKDLSFDRRVENGSITFDFNSSSSSMSARLEGAENADNQHSAQSSIVSGLGDGALDSLTGSTRSFFIQHGLGESDFLGSVSGPIAYSGSIPFSGNISHRSDSSTASTCSFAFPTLQPEWNSSPVKMAKADRRQLKWYHRCWRIPIWCCKF